MNTTLQFSSAATCSTEAFGTSVTHCNVEFNVELNAYVMFYTYSCSVPLLLLSTLKGLLYSALKNAKYI